MKKVINGRMYNTITAQKMATRAKKREEMQAHWAYWEEALYMKKTGEFFLYATGGPSSCYRDKNAAGLFTSGEKILPLTDSEAAEWCHQDGQTPWAAWH